jgi:hypothetical protein
MAFGVTELEQLRSVLIQIRPQILWSHIAYQALVAALFLAWATGSTSEELAMPHMQMTATAPAPAASNPLQVPGLVSRLRSSVRVTLRAYTRVVAAPYPIPDPKLMRPARSPVFP